MRAVLTLALVCLCAACAPEYEEAEPPLRTLIYTETPGYDPEKAVELEEHLLSVFETSGNIPTAAESAAMLTEQAPEEGEGFTGQEMLDMLVPRPEGDEEDPKKKEGEEDPKKEGEEDPKKEGEGPHLSSPETLAEKVFEALVKQDEALFDRVLIDTEGLMALARIKAPTARRRARALRKAAHKAYSVFSPKNPSEEPHGGLGTKVSLVEVKIGKAGTIWGRAPKQDEEVVQHWGNLLTFQLDTDLPEKAKPILFTISLGRMLKSPDGQWHMASAPEVSSTFRAYLATGFHLKPELMQPEHHTFPLSVGNYWRYRIKRPNNAPLPVEEGVEANVEEIRIEVTDVERGDGYRVVTLKRARKKGGDTTRDTLHYLVTPKRLYTCSSYCKYKSKDLGYLLGYTRTQTPLLIFPLKPGMSWKVGGVLATRSARFLARERTELVTVPAGEFTDAIVIAGKRSQSYITRYFKSGVGIVQRVIRSPDATRVEELIEYRILTTE